MFFIPPVVSTGGERYSRYGIQKLRYSRYGSGVGCLNCTAVTVTPIFAVLDRKPNTAVVLKYIFAIDKFFQPLIFVEILICLSSLGSL